ncbi:MAG: Collagen triple helix repeat-containing protein, partial [Nocardioides sp.]|nr:Collagen triple helix repeat-containing protein [Nocardioides sp.]
MLRYLVRQKAAIAAVAGVALIVSVGGAYATSADGNKVMHGCVRLKTGDLRVETQGSPCVTDGPWSQRERAESWNQQGVVGADGADGAAGPAGADGTDGAIGPMGPVGAAGDRGPAGSAGAIGPVG